MPPSADLPFPHVNQVFLVERGVTDLHGKSLARQTADPATLAQFVRGHWGIKSLHRIRGTIYREDQGGSGGFPACSLIQSPRTLTVVADRGVIRILRPLPRQQM